MDHWAKDRYMHSENLYVWGTFGTIGSVIPTFLTLSAVEEGIMYYCIEVINMILVSSCLAGLEVRYNGTHCLDDRISQMLEEKKH